jgi:integrative and conjugative element protein (TIGR02256 family)
MLQQLSSGFVVWELDGVCGSFSPNLLSLLKKWQQTRYFSKEAGGVLLGFIDKASHGLLAENITAPGKGDRRGRTSFFRSERHQKEVDVWHKITNEKGTQLGFWHTHPEPKPIPSSVDFDDFRSAITTGIYHEQGIVYIIVGTESVGCWFGRRGCGIKLIGYFEL